MKYLTFQPEFFLRRELLVSLLLVAAVAAVYWPVHSYPFVLLDDHGYVVENPYVRNGLTRESIGYALTGITVGNWHPVTMLSHMLVCQVFGAADGGWHHTVNVVLHAVNAVLLLIVLRRMTGAFWRSALVAALFALHPLHVESVAWVSERKDVLSTLFFMLTLIAYQHYVRRPTMPRYAAVFVLLALGLMSKPMLVTAPFVLLLLDYWPLGRMRLGASVGVPDSAGMPEAIRRPRVHDAQAELQQVEGEDDEEEPESGESEADEPGNVAIVKFQRPPGDESGKWPHLHESGTADPGDVAAVEEEEQPPADEAGKLPLAHLIAEKIPLLVLAVLSAVITYAVQQASGAMGMLGQQVPFLTRLGNAVFACGQYLEKSFWPSPLAAVYPYVNRKPIDVLIIGLALAAISIAAVRLARIRPFLIVGWCWFLGTLVPVIGLVQVGVQSMADRYAYIPLIGIFIIFAWGAAEFCTEWPVRNKALAAAALLSACGWCTWRQVATWSSSEALYSHAVEAERYNFVAMHGLGMVYWKDGKLDEAQQQFEAILKIMSDPKVRLEGGLEPAYRALGLLMAVRQQPKLALQLLDQASKTRPQQPEPLRHKAWILATSPEGDVRDGRKAVETAQEALEKSPRKEPEYWDTLAAAEAEAGKFPEAVAAAEKALEEARFFHADDLVPGIQRRLELFKSGRRYHAPAEHPQRM